MKTIINSVKHKFDKIRHFILFKTSESFRRKLVIFRFVLAGAVASLTQILGVTIFYEKLGYDIIPATTLAFIIAFLASFSLQKFWTFRDFRSKVLDRQLSIFLVLAVINLIINDILMHFLVNTFSIWYIFAQFATSGMIGIYSFLAYKFVIFKPHS